MFRFVVQYRGLDGIGDVGFYDLTLVAANYPATQQITVGQYSTFSAAQTAAQAIVTATLTWDTSTPPDDTYHTTAPFTHA